MDSGISFESKFKFPTKESMRPVSKPNAKIRSNHFREQVSKEGQIFVEWFVSFIKQSDLAKYLNNKNDVRPDAVSPDSRYLITTIWQRNRGAIDRKIGRHFLTGVTLFSAPDLCSQIQGAHFTEHAEYVMIIEKKNELLKLKDAYSGERKAELLRFLNTTLKNKMMFSNYVEIGKNKKYYNKDNVQRIQVGDFAYEVYLGYKTAYDVYEDGLRLLVDYTTRIIHESSVWEDVQYYRKAKGMSDLQIIEQIILGRSIWTAYGSQKSYKIDKVITDKGIDSPFPNPEYKSYRDYFAKRYKLKLNDPKQWLLVHVQVIRDRDPSGKVISERFQEHVFPSELVKSTGIPEEERANYQVMKAFAELTCIAPDKRFARYQDLINQLNNNTSKSIKDVKIDPINVKIDSKANTCDATFLQKPRILSKPGSGSVPARERIDVKSLYSQQPLLDWVVVYDKFNDRNLDTIIGNLISSCDRFGIKVNDPFVYMLPQSNKPQDLQKKMEASKDYRKPSIIFFAIGKRGANKIYKEMKEFFTEKGIPLQFFVSFNPKKDMNANSKYSNLVLQMVNKMGSNLWVIDRTLDEGLVIGAMTANASKGQTIITMASQFGKNFSHNFFTAKIIGSQAKPAVGEAMAQQLIEQVEGYKSLQKKLPKLIIFYRQGTSEGQLQQVQQDEVQKLVNTLQSKYGAQKPKIVIMVVTKRIDDRFATEQGGRHSNPGCGLIVDSSVTKEARANFYMVAQFVNQGSANPTHYDVLYNDTPSSDGKNPGMSLLELETITYELCWAYTNWMGPIKVPAPLQYANKLSVLKAITLNATVETSLKYLPYCL